MFVPYNGVPTPQECTNIIERETVMANRLDLLLILSLLASECGLDGAGVPSADQAVRPTLATQEQTAPSPASDASTPTVAERVVTPSARATREAPAASASLDASAPAAITPEPFTPDGGGSAPAATTAPTVATANTSGNGSDAAPFAPSSAATAETVNIALVFDASGSMAQPIPGSGETRIQAARRAMEQVIAQLPDEGANLNVGFRVYDHRGDNSEAGKAESCQSTELLVPIDGVDKAALLRQTNAFEPTGWTPITLALTAAGNDLRPGENVRNVIIMVTDGEETCAGDPCAVAESLARSEAEVRIDVVGFGQDPTLQDKLQCVADNSGGTFTDAQDGEALTQTLEDLISDALQRSYLRVIALGPDGQQLGKRHEWNAIVTITAVVDAQGRPAPVDPETLENDRKRTPLEGDGEQLIELPPGTYRFTIRQRRDFRGGENSALPEANNQITYTAEVAEGQTTTAVVGVGAIRLANGGVDEQVPCNLRLEVAVDGRWEVAHREAQDPPCSTLGGMCADLEFDRDYPLLPGRYRLVDPARGRVIADNIVLEPGKRVSITVAD
jgi:Mg-chelatase subunit ChlD